MTAPTHTHWIQTHCGEAFDLLAPQPSQVHLRDITNALSRQPRFAGHTHLPWSVAQHSLLVAHLLTLKHAPPLTVLQGLLHDAQEAYLVDIPTPLKHLLSGYAEVEARVWAAIAERAGVPMELDPLVKWADTEALRLEAHHLFRGGPLMGWCPPPEGGIFAWLTMEPHNRYIDSFAVCQTLYSHIKKTQCLAGVKEFE